jgi:hypothetical protein
MGSVDIRFNVIEQRLDKDVDLKGLPFLYILGFQLLELDAWIVTTH